MKNYVIGGIVILMLLGSFFGIKYFSEENQNALNKSIQDQVGLNFGKVEVYVGQAIPVRRFFKVQKLSVATSKGLTKSYGYGYIDKNKNNKLDPDEKKIGKKYFELPEYSQYIYFDASE